MNKSEKLAKLFGIKPDKYCYGCIGDDGKRIEDSINCPARNGCINTCDIPHYTDFTNPNNFIKLLEMPLGPNTFGWRVENYYMEYGAEFSLIGNRELFLTWAINYLSSEPMFIEQIKQQAQQTKWEY